MKEHLAAAARTAVNFPDERFVGRGIVICAGGARLFTCAWVLIGILRRELGCTLPIEVWYLGPGEVGLPMRGLLNDLGAQPVDGFEVAKRQQVEQLGGWELKPYALMNSRFREVILIDADNIPLRDPALLFETPEFCATGTIFWPDLVKLAPNNPVWELANIDYRDTWSIESGQMVLDKSRCWRALSLTHWINQHSNDFYEFLHGDKDTFLIAWLILSQPYHLIPHRPKLLESTICQRDREGRVLFQHRNMAKWILNGENPRIEGFRLEDECRGLLRELSRLWDGRIFNPPGRSEVARRLEDDLSRVRHFRLVRVSSNEGVVELLADHRVVSGASLTERYWYVADGAHGPELRLEGNGIESCALEFANDGIWRGKYLQRPYMPIELVPVPPDFPAQSRATGDPADSLMPLVKRILEAGEALPSDREVERDIVGALRILAAIDFALLDRLKEEQQRVPSTSSRSRIIAMALERLADTSRRPDSGELKPGHNWLSAPDLNWEGYKRG
ncbi:MAG TPA: hypothetical protein VMA09_00510 [Candidatus Binataceae bacterium]|nr:hypothetical protein [Candidatus Binataceae bacterium]